MKSRYRSMNQPPTHTQKPRSQNSLGHQNHAHNHGGSSHSIRKSSIAIVAATFIIHMIFVC